MSRPKELTRSKPTIPTDIDRPPTSHVAEEAISPCERHLLAPSSSALRSLRTLLTLPFHLIFHPGRIASAV